VAQRALNPTEFADTVDAITAAFGDPTRRNIYLLVRERPEGLTAGEVAEATGLHANVARHHLEKLVTESYLDTTQRASSGAGRPAKVYRTTGPELFLDLQIRRDDILVTLLGKALARLEPEQAAALAEEVGQEFGRQMATTVGETSADEHSFRTALHLVADALSSHGFAAHAEKDGEELRIVAGQCPFGDVAIEHPVICAVDRGMVKGMLGSLYGEGLGETQVALASSVARGDDACATDVTLGAPPGAAD
jgi:predicted ArsR family transcriptional regulator